MRALIDGGPFTKAPKRIRAEVATTEVGGRPALLALPMTFMNESGIAVSALARYYKVEPDRIVVVHDDIDLPFGKLRFGFGRGAGGNRGVESVVQALGSPDIWRLKLGVGRPPGQQDPAAFVLRRFSKQERLDVDFMVVEAADVLSRFGAEGDEAAQRQAGEASRRLGDGPRAL